MRRTSNLRGPAIFTGSAVFNKISDEVLSSPNSREDCRCELRGTPLNNLDGVLGTGTPPSRHSRRFTPVRLELHVLPIPPAVRLAPHVLRDRSPSQCSDFPFLLYCNSWGRLLIDFFVLPRSRSRSRPKSDFTYLDHLITDTHFSST